MVSSTTHFLLDDRKEILNFFNNYQFFNCLGSGIFNNNSNSASSWYSSLNYAKNSNLYILILSFSYGFVLKNGKSATEIEFDAAYANDPTKILVFHKLSMNRIEPKQQKFIKKVTDYYSGYWVSNYNNKLELKNKFENSLQLWIKERASFNGSLNYFDHFIRIAKNIRSGSNSNVNYRVTQKEIELEYKSFDSHVIIHFEKKSIYKDFWSCIYSLKLKLDKWEKE